MNAKETRFYYRQSDKFHDSVIKIEVFNGTDWLNGMELESSYKARSLSPIGRKLDATICLMKAYGLQDVHIPRLLSRKQVRIKSEVLPLEELKDKLGWSPLDYPVKFGGTRDWQKMYKESYDQGIGIDVSNLIANHIVADTNGLALKGLVDEMERMCYPYFLYVDWRTWGWIEFNRLMSLYAYLQSFYNVSGKPVIKTADPDETADDLMVRRANAYGQHLITRDELDEYDVHHDWLLHGAERGEPRVHKFYRRDNRLLVPDYGFDIEIPTSF